MKLNALSYLGITTFLLILVIIFVTLDLSFGLVFVSTVVGQIMLIYTVFKILKDDYSTDKTFDDLYEDRPDLGQNFR